MPKSVRTVKSSKKPRKNIPARIIKKKPYFELAAAFLSIPVLITVLLLNVSSLRNMGKEPTPTPPHVNSGGFFAAPVGTKQPTIIPNSTVNQDPCTKALGPVEISSPGEGDTVQDNPVTINISYDDTTYCGAAWAYRINGGSWSGYDDRSVALYNLPRGQVTFELRVKSIVTTDEKTLTRKFFYDGKQAVAIPDPNSSGSAN